MSELMQVAVGVITSNMGQVLVAKRPEGSYMSGYWEFPGGKLEAGETAKQALKRELLEELGIHMLASKQLMTFAYQYPDREVMLDVWHVLQFDGIERGCEGQELAWVTAKQLSALEFPMANERIIPIVQAILHDSPHKTS